MLQTNLRIIEAWQKVPFHEFLKSLHESSIYTNKISSLLYLYWFINFKVSMLLEYNLICVQKNQKSLKVEIYSLSYMIRTCFSQHMNVQNEYWYNERF